MSGQDREPIGSRSRKRRAKPPHRGKKRHYHDDDIPLYSRDHDDEYDYDEEYDDHDEYDDEEDEAVSEERPRRKRHRFFWFCFKLGLILLAVIVFYGFYLDSQIRQRIEGKIWDLPAAVYGRMVNLGPGMHYTKKDMVTLLEGIQYREVSRITRPGEFTVGKSDIEMLRRPFDFPDAKEGQIRARLYFDQNTLTRIENLDTKRDFGYFRLDPRLITMMQSASGEQRLFVPRSGFPNLLVDTLLVTEDRDFYKHDGVSFYSIGRAAIANLLAGRTVQGGSTLTQQLVKNLFLSNERSIWRKINEAYMAMLMDYRYGKERILELYLNEVFLGQSGNDEISGFPLASLYYFGRPVDELSLDQQAMLVGMVKGASYYNPWRNPQRTLERRNLVLKLLENQKMIDGELYNMLSARPLGVQPKGGVIAPQPAFMEMVRKELQQRLRDKARHLSGAKVFTTLDPIAQDAAEKAVSEGIPELRKARSLSDLEGAMVVVDRLSGEIRALVGGVETQYAGFNRALAARRSVGSLIKPSVYLTALSQPTHFRLNTWLADQPILIAIPGGKSWEPKNFDRRYRGQVLLVDALASSINIPTVNLGMTLGLPAVVQVLQELGVDNKIIEPVPAMLLGAINLTPIEVAQMFQTIGSGGNRAHLSALRSVIGEDGTVLYQSFPQSERTKPAQAAYLTLYGMQQAVARGTGRALTSKFHDYNLAGKTGTTNELRDSWFAGIDEREVAIAWVGRDNNQPTKLTGSTGALMIYRRFLENQTPVPLILQVPDEIVPMQVDDNGDFVCSGGGIRMLPVWTDNPQQLCTTKGSGVVSYQGPNMPQAAPTAPTVPPQPAQSEPGQSQPIQAVPPAAAPATPQADHEKEAPEWVKEMFGQQ